MAAARVLNSAMRTIVERGGESAQVFLRVRQVGLDRKTPAWRHGRRPAGWQGETCPTIHRNQLLKRGAPFFRIAEEFLDPDNFVFPFAIPLTDHGPSGGGDALPQRVIGETLFDGFSEAGCGSVTQQAVLANRGGATRSSGCGCVVGTRGVRIQDKTGAQTRNRVAEDADLLEVRSAGAVGRGDEGHRDGDGTHAGALDGDVCGHRAGALGCQGLVDANREAEAVNRQAPRSRGLVEHTRSGEITQVQRLDEGDIVERRPSGGKRRRYIRDDTASGIHVHELADVKATGRYSAGESGEVKATVLAGVVPEGATQGRPVVTPPARVCPGQLVETNVGAGVTLTVIGTCTVAPPVAAVAVNVMVPLKVAGAVMPTVHLLQCKRSGIGLNVRFNHFQIGSQELVRRFPRFRDSARCYLVVGDAADLVRVAAFRAKGPSCQ